MTKITHVLSVDLIPADAMALRQLHSYPSQGFSAIDALH
jgi:hypothetical protein